MVAAKLDQSRVLLTKFRQSWLTLKVEVPVRHTHMECTVDVDGLRHRWVRRWATSPIRDVASVAWSSRAGDVDGLLLASCPFPIQLSNPRLLECRDGRLTSGARHCARSSAAVLSDLGCRPHLFMLTLTVSL